MKLIKIGAIWCPACLIMNTRIKKLKDKYKHIEYIDYDLDQDSDKVKKYEVGNILPVFILEDKNKEIVRLIGEKSLKDLEEFIEKNVVIE